MSTASDYKPNFDLTGSVMLVTGPARGLGRASTLACAAAGADIVLGLRDKGSDGGLAAEIEGMGRKVLPVQLDVTRMDQVRERSRQGERPDGPHRYSRQQCRDRP